jgi:prepilin-type N-terminal cleavage/methylation domain-containing protein
MRQRRAIMHGLSRDRRSQPFSRWESAGFRRRRAGFTLVELLISMSILLILATLTLRLVSGTLDSDRLKTGSRELQSFLAGARDRATYAGLPRGVRFIPNPSDYSTVSGFVYIGAPSAYTDNALLDISSTGVISFEAPNTLTSLQNWQSLWARGVLINGTQIQLTQGTTALGFITVAATNFIGVVPQSFAITTVTGISTPVTGLKYTLQLAPTVLPGDEPRSLPRGIVIDLNNSVLPASWGTAFSPTTPPQGNLDLLLSPRGAVIGPAASDGRIHFVLSDIADTTGQAVMSGLAARYRLNAAWQPNTTYAVGNVIVPTPSSFIAFRCINPGTTGAAATQPAWPTQPNVNVNDAVANMWQSFVKKSNLIISVATASGRVTTHPVDVATQLIPAGTGYDTFRFAEIGEVTQ